MIGHNGSISKVKVDSRNVAISAAYDSTLLVWQLDTLECAQGLFKGHKDAVMEFEWNNSLCVSGDRSGGLTWWDINTGTPIKTQMVHSGGVSKIALHSTGDSNLIVSSGLKDGSLSVFDMRTHKVVMKEKVCGGAINLLEISDQGQIVCGASDSSVKVFDIGNSKPS